MDNINVLKNSEGKKVELTNEATKAKKSTGRKRTESTYLKIRNRAANIYKVQLIKSAEVKKASIIKACSEIARGNYDLDEFKAEFKQGVDRLLDSKKFENACVGKLEPFNVATHIVFDGASKINLVLNDGLEFVYPNQLTKMVEPIFTELELQCATDPECEGCPPKEENLSEE